MRCVLFNELGRVEKIVYSVADPLMLRTARYVPSTVADLRVGDDDPAGYRVDGHPMYGPRPACAVDEWERAGYDPARDEVHYKIARRDA